MRMSHRSVGDGPACAKGSMVSMPWLVRSNQL